MTLRSHLRPSIRGSTAIDLPGRCRKAMKIRLALTTCPVLIWILKHWIN